MNETIKISGLKKSYGTHVVLNGWIFVYGKERFSRCSV